MPMTEAGRRVAEARAANGGGEGGVWLVFGDPLAEAAPARRAVGPFRAAQVAPLAVWGCPVGYGEPVRVCTRGELLEWHLDGRYGPAPAWGRVDVVPCRPGVTRESLERG